MSTKSFVNIVTRDEKPEYEEVKRNVEQAGMGVLERFEKSYFHPLRPDGREEYKELIVDVATKVINNATEKFKPVPSDKLLESAKKVLDSGLRYNNTTSKHELSDKDRNEVAHELATHVIGAMEKKAKEYALGAQQKAIS